MLRKIVDFKKLTPEILSLLVEKYPHGYDDGAIITFKNAKNETIEAVEVLTDEVIYLVKVSSKLVVSMATFDSDDYKIEEADIPIADLSDKKED